MEVPVGSRGEAPPVDGLDSGSRSTPEAEVFFIEIIISYFHIPGSQNQRGAKGVYGSHGRTTAHRAERGRGARSPVI